ncbi:chitobiase/beta-hexosaminidase C-terminal domain-containing protein [uncultured Sphaerochaeta sp.]|uniref:chitobiase/beta-hexosaminidase C-terminal domain-containing protein n=1 Tax=uncultured Sphaerochaeta sp. TaxID=886478 RepID=UPI002A0A6B12|nr:FN3 associated domain-containing protein [uncultured Sphaerochaeta sp.]
MHKRDTQLILLVILEVVILMATAAMLAPERWPKTGTVELTMSIPQNERPAYLRVSGKSGSGKILEPSVRPFSAVIPISDIPEGLWNISLEALDTHGIVTARSTLESIRVKQADILSVSVTLAPVWTGSFDIVVTWPLDLGTFTKAVLTCPSLAQVEALPVLGQDYYTASFHGYGLPLGTYSFDLMLSNSQGGTLKVPSFDTFTVTPTSRKHSFTEDLSNYGFLSHESVPVPSVLPSVSLPPNPVSVTLTNGLPQNLVLATPDSGVAVYYRYALNDEPLPETFSEGRLVIVPETNSLTLETYAERGSEKSSTTQVRYEAVSVPSLSLPEGTYSFFPSVEVKGENVLVSIDNNEFNPAEGSISIDHDGMLLKAYAFGEGKLNSPVVSSCYHLQAAQPSISFSFGQIILHTDTSAGAIYYTLDGSQPSISSSLYTEPISLSSSATIRALASCEGMQDSPIASLVVNVPQAIAPYIALEEGVVVISSSSDSSLVKYHTAIDNESFSPYEKGPFFSPEPGHSVRVEAYAEENGAEPSSVVAAFFPVALQPVFEEDGSFFEEPFVLHLKGPKSLVYRIDDGPYIPYDGPISIDRNLTVTVIGQGDGQIDSLPVSRSYRIKVSTPVILLTPLANGTKQVSVSCATEDAILTCKVGDREFNYKDPFILSQTSTIQVVATKQGLVSSSASMAAAVVSHVDAPSVTISKGDEQMAILSCITPRATIRYRLGNTEWKRIDSFIEGTQVPLLSGSPATLQAYASVSGMIDSPFTTVLFPVVSPPSFDKAAGVFEQPIAVLLGAGNVRYRIDGGPYTDYDGTPLPIDTSCTIEAYRWEEGKVNSKTVEHTFSIEIAEPELILPAVMEGKLVQETEQIPKAIEKAEPPAILQKENIKKLDVVYTVGQKGPAGGLVFYDKGFYSHNWRYLEAAPADETITAEWGQYGATVKTNGTSLGDGMYNTVHQVIADPESPTAAWICDHKVVVVDAHIYDDWYLPSRDELALLRSAGMLTGSDYWSSSEISATMAWENSGTTDLVGPYYKSALHAVRAIRAF